MITPPLRKLSPAQYKKIVLAHPHLIRPLTPTERAEHNEEAGVYYENKQGFRMDYIPFENLDPKETWLSSAEACGFLNVSTTTLTKYTRLGRLRRELVGRKVGGGFSTGNYYTLSSLEAVKEALTHKNKKNHG